MQASEPFLFLAPWLIDVAFGTLRVVEGAKCQFLHQSGAGCVSELCIRHPPRCGGCQTQTSMHPVPNGGIFGTCVFGTLGNAEGAKC